MTEAGKQAQTYWETREHLNYLRDVRVLASKVGADAESIIDVGSNACPYLEWFDWVPRRVSIDISKPYSSATVQGIRADFLKSELGSFDLCLCLQVLEHIPDAETFARKLLAIAPRVIASVPYMWPDGSCKWHVHDPVDEIKMQSWFGRSPQLCSIVQETHAPPNHRRMICYYEA
jgi:hypothetical protein